MTTRATSTIRTTTAPIGHVQTGRSAPPLAVDSVFAGESCAVCVMAVGHLTLGAAFCVHVKRSIRNIPAQFIKPDGCLRITWCAPIAARTEGAAGADFGTIRQAGALELTNLKEAEKKYLQPLLNGREIVLAVFGDWKVIGPGATRLIAPGGFAEK